MDSARSYLSWDDIVSRADGLNLSPQQAKQAIDRRDDASQATDLRIGQTYVHAIVPEQPNPGQPITWSVEKADGQETPEAGARAVAWGTPLLAPNASQIVHARQCDDVGREPGQ